MSETLHKLQVVIEGNTSKLNQAAREAMATTRRLTDSLNAEMRRINSPVENLRKSMNDSRNDFGLGKLHQVMREIRNYGKEAQVAAGIKVYTDDYKKLGNDIVRARGELTRLRQKLLYSLSSHLL